MVFCGVDRTATMVRGPPRTETAGAALSGRRRTAHRGRHGRDRCGLDRAEQSDGRPAGLVLIDPPEWRAARDVFQRHRSVVFAEVVARQPARTCRSGTSRERTSGARRRRGARIVDGRGPTAVAITFATIDDYTAPYPRDVQGVLEGSAARTTALVPWCRRDDQLQDSDHHARRPAAHLLRRLEAPCQRLSDSRRRRDLRVTAVAVPFGCEHGAVPTGQTDPV